MNLLRGRILIKYQVASNDVLTYHIYMLIANSGIKGQEDIIICTVQKQKIINSTVIPFPSIPANLPHEEKVTLYNTFFDNIFQVLREYNKDILDTIKNDTQNNIIYTLKYEDEIDEHFSFYIKHYNMNFSIKSDIEDYKQFLNKQANEIQKLYKSNNNNTEISLNKQIQIEVYYSHIDVLNQIIDKCQKAKVKYKFERIAKSIKRLLYKYAIKNNDLLQAFNKVCNTNNTYLVATYYSKKIMNNDQIDENYCAGIIIKFNNTFMTIPSHAYSSFNNIIREYNRVKDELNNRSFFKKIKDQFDNGAHAANALLSSNFSIKDIASNPYIRRDKAIYKYIIKNVHGIKEFLSFSEANAFFKKYTLAQYIQVSPSFSYLDYNDVNVQEYKLRLTIKLNDLNESVLRAIDRIILNNKQYILNIDEVNKIIASTKKYNK